MAFDKNSEDKEIKPNSSQSFKFDFSKVHVSNGEGAQLELSSEEEMEAYIDAYIDVSGIKYMRDSRINRRMLQKQFLKTLFPDVFDPSLTEQQILAKKHIYPVYNSSYFKYVLPI
jgi:hypothetical protein